MRHTALFNTSTATMADDPMHFIEWVTLNTSDVELHAGCNDTEVDPPSSPLIICLLSLIFVLVGVVGVAGNTLVGAAILGDSRMLHSPTNALILNLAAADLLIMVSCVPEIVQFIGNRGWRLGLELCKALRFTENFALYASVLTLLTLCIERYVAIVHPIRAHLLCCRGRIVTVLSIIWPFSMLCACPNLLFHVIAQRGPDFTPCLIQFQHIMALKYAESVLFYFIPLVIQVVLYTRIGVRLFRGGTALDDGRHDSMLRARRGVVKMLMAGVAVYFISFSPHQVLLLYNALSTTPFSTTWSFLILSNLMAYTSSACNPLLYSAFSHKFRRKFAQILKPCGVGPQPSAGAAILVLPRGSSSSPSNGTKFCFGNCLGRGSHCRSVKTTVTEL